MCVIAELYCTVCLTSMEIELRPHGVHRQVSNPSISSGYEVLSNKIDIIAYRNDIY